MDQNGDLAFVAADDRDGARQMVRYLVRQGRRRIGMITGPLDTPGGVDRLAGYLDVFGDDDRDRLVVTGDYVRDSGEASMETLLQQAPNIDAVFVASDLMAAGALTALRRAGRRVPEDVAVGGFDDSSVATLVRPALTTIRQPMERISAEMVRLLMDLIVGKPPAAFTVPTELVRRESA